jgi:Xaa-Pro aminopeptidase
MYYLTDWTKRVDFDQMRDLRLQAIRLAMRHAGLDAILAFKYENTRQLAGLRPLWFPLAQLRNAAVMTPDSDVILFVTGGDHAHRLKTMYWLKPDNVRPLAALEEPDIVPKALPAIVQALRELGTGGGKIGIDTINLFVLEAMQKELPGAKFVDCDTLLRQTRLIKNAEEIKLMRHSSLCVDLGMQTAIESIQVGVRECELLGEAMRTMYGCGMEISQCSSIVASGENLAPLTRFASDKQVQYGDLVFMDIGGCFNGMFAEATRTACCGEPNDMQRRIAEAVYAAMVAAVRSMKPGNTNDDVARATQSAYRKYDFEQYALRTVLGHSIGLAGWEPPTLGDPAFTGSVFELKAGMIFSVEPTVIVPDVPGGGGIRIEDEVLVTNSGPELLTRAPLDRRIYPSVRLEI